MVRLFLTSYRDEEGILNTLIEPPIKFPTFSDDKDKRLYRRTQVFNDALETMVNRHPEQWLWLHRRLKPFIGASKWNFRSRILASLLWALLFLSGCSSEPITPTGIALPPDPKIAVPEFKLDAPSFEESNLDAPPPLMKAAEADPKLKKKVVAAEKNKSKKEMTVVQSPPPSPPSFDVLPNYKIPFEIGERLEIAMGWMGLPAGTATLEVREGQNFQDRKTFHLWGNILSSKLVDAIYHVDNTVESFVDASALIPYKFLLHMVETAQKKETRVSFDHLQKKAFYWSKRLSQKWGDEDVDRSDELVAGAKDLWSGVYFARTLNFKPNEKQSVYVYENGKNYKVELLQVGSEMVQTKVGAFQCSKISVTITLDNVLRPTGDIFMWLSEDSKRYLVKFDAKIKIGSLYGNLISIREKK